MLDALLLQFVGAVSLAISSLILQLTISASPVLSLSTIVVFVPLVLLVPNARQDTTS